MSFTPRHSPHARCCFRLCERCSPDYARLEDTPRPSALLHAAPMAAPSPLDNIQMLLAPNVWNLLPIASCLWNDVTR